MAFGGYSGKSGTVKIGTADIIDVTAWNASWTSSNPAAATNQTNGYKARVAGVKDITGTISGLMNATSQTTVIGPGTTATLVLHTDTSQTLTVPAIIENFDITVDVDNGDYVRFTANFAGSGTAPTDSL